MSTLKENWGKRGRSPSNLLSLEVDIYTHTHTHTHTHARARARARRRSKLLSCPPANGPICTLMTGSPISLCSPLAVVHHGCRVTCFSEDYVWKPCPFQTIDGAIIGSAVLPAIATIPLHVGISWVELQGDKSEFKLSNGLSRSCREKKKIIIL